MNSSKTAAPLITKKLDHNYFVKLVQTSAISKVEAPNAWSEGRRLFLQRHQERYLKRLTVLREALLRENKDYVRQSLPKNCDKNTGFWETIMADFETIPKRFPNGRTHRPTQSSVGGSLTDEQNRRAHLERLRRIRIMQMRKRQPPQLEPLHGIGLGAKKDSTAKEINKQNQRVLPTAYHIDWMRGSHVITPIGDHEKAINSWTLKHLRTVDAEISDKVKNNFPDDIRSLLRKTRRSVDLDSVTQKEVIENRTETGTITQRSPNVPSAPATMGIGSLASTTHKTINDPLPQTPINLPPAPRSTPTPISPFASEIISYHSSSSSRPKSSTFYEDAHNEGDEYNNDIANREVQIIDRATSPMGFRLPSLRSIDNVSDSASSKRHIVVKVPDGIK